MVFRPRVKSYNPINDIFAITNLFGNQFYANNENDLRSKTLHKSFVRSTLVVVIYEKGFKHAVPLSCPPVLSPCPVLAKNRYLHITQLIT